MSDNPRLQESLDATVGKTPVRVSDPKENEVIQVDGIHYVGFWRRFFAFLLDSIILGYSSQLIQSSGVSFILAVSYYVFLTSSPIQGTIGKLAIGAWN
jgi:hypothetical protein